MNRSGLFRWTKNQFHSAAAAGWFTDRKVELLGGFVYTMTTNPPHMTATLNLEDLFRNLLPSAQWFNARELTIEMGSWMPIPDIAVVRGSRDQYKQLSQRQLHTGKSHDLALDGLDRQICS
jgi:hypothetical protein